MYKAIIVEDEQRLSQALQLLLDQVAKDKVKVIGIAEKVNDAVELITKLQPDIVFMDIQLKDGTGFEVLDRTTHSFYPIFTTAYEQHAIRAFKYSAIDYLLKPIDPEELKNAIERITLTSQKFAKAAQVAVLQTALQQKTDKLTLSTSQGLFIVPLNEIIRCETSGSYTTFYCTGNKKIMVAKPLKHYDDILSAPGFFRIHQSHTINMQFIHLYKNGQLQLKDSTVVPVAQRKKEAFLQLLQSVTK